MSDEARDAAFEKWWQEILDLPSYDSVVPKSQILTHYTIAKQSWQASAEAEREKPYRHISHVLNRLREEYRSDSGEYAGVLMAIRYVKDELATEIRARGAK